MDPITALAAFNASYAVIKTTAQNAGEISQIFANIGKMIQAKQVIDKAAQADPEKSDLELYANHVEMEQKWDEVVEMLKWTGHWSAYQEFVQNRREEEKRVRIKAIREAQAKKQQMIDTAIIIGGVTASVAVIVTFLWVIGKFKGAA